MKASFKDTTDCPNCSTCYSGNFCPNCGQRSKIKELSVKETLRQIPKAIFFIESRFQHLLFDFFKNPAETIKAFSKGKRKKYGSPIHYFYFFSTVEFLLSSIYYNLLYSESDAESGVSEDYGIFDRFAKGIDLAADLEDTIYFSLTNPIFLGLVVAWYLRKKLNLAESIVYAFVYYSFVTLFWILDRLLLFIGHLLEQNITIDFYFIPEAVFLGFLFSRSLKGLRFVQFLKGFVAYYLSLFFIFITALIFITLYVYIQ